MNLPENQIFRVSNMGFKKGTAEQIRPMPFMYLIGRVTVEYFKEQTEKVLNHVDFSWSVEEVEPEQVPEGNPLINYEDCGILLEHIKIMLICK